MTTLPTALIDIGANLTHESFDRDRAQVLSRACAENVTLMIVTGSDVNASHAALALCNEYPGLLYSTAGVHPHHAQLFDTGTPAALRQLLVQNKVVAIGECGLDYFRDFSPRAAQTMAFEAQLQLAAETGKPVFLHQRDAHTDFMRILQRYRGYLGACVLHCFTGSESELIDYLQLDLYIGITGWICDERRGMHLRELVKSVSKDRIMLETDAPYLLPRDIRPHPPHRRNEPMYLPHVCARVAVCRGESFEDIATITTENARRFFQIADV